MPPYLTQTVATSLDSVGDRLPFCEEVEPESPVNLAGATLFLRSQGGLEAV